MDATKIRNLVECQLEAEGSFTNMHGITGSNLRSRLCEPFEVVVDPGQLRDAPRPMWVVLQERDAPCDGYVADVPRFQQLVASADEDWAGYATTTLEGLAFRAG